MASCGDADAYATGVWLLRGSTVLLLAALAGATDTKLNTKNPNTRDTPIVEVEPVTEAKAVAAAAEKPPAAPPLPPIRVQRGTITNLIRRRGTNIDSSNKNNGILAGFTIRPPQSAVVANSGDSATASANATPAGYRRARSGQSRDVVLAPTAVSISMDPNKVKQLQFTL